MLYNNQTKPNPNSYNDLLFIYYIFTKKFNKSNNPYLKDVLV